MLHYRMILDFKFKYVNSMGYLTLMHFTEVTITFESNYKPKLLCLTYVFTTYFQEIG